MCRPMGLGGARWCRWSLVLALFLVYCSRSTTSQHSSPKPAHHHKVHRHHKVHTRPTHAPAGEGGEASGLPSPGDILNMLDTDGTIDEPAADVAAGAAACKDGWLVHRGQTFWEANDDKSPGLGDILHAQDRIFATFSLKIPVEFRNMGWHAGTWTMTYHEAGNLTVLGRSLGVGEHGHTFTLFSDLPLQLRDHNPDVPLHMTIKVSLSPSQQRTYDNIPFCLYPQSGPSSRYQHLTACTMLTARVAHAVPEWVVYHHLQGFEHFDLYIDDDPAPVRKLLAPLVDAGLVTVVDWQWPPRYEGHFQQQQLQQCGCLMRARARSRWVALTDVDEFLQVTDGSNDTVAQFLSRHAHMEHVGAFQVSGMSFGSHVDAEKQKQLTDAGKGLLLGTYATRNNEVIGDKLLGRPENINYMSVHLVTGGGRMHEPDPLKELRFVHFKDPVQRKYDVPDMSLHAHADAVYRQLQQLNMTNSTSTPR